MVKLIGEITKTINDKNICKEVLAKLPNEQDSCASGYIREAMVKSIGKIAKVIGDEEHGKWICQELLNRLSKA